MCLVPIQKSLSTRPLALKGAESALKEKCNKKEILVRELRKHLWDCEDADTGIQPMESYAMIHVMM